MKGQVIIKKGQPVVHNGVLSNVIETGVKMAVIRNIFDQEDRVVEVADLSPVNPDSIDDMKKVMSSGSLMKLAERVFNESHIDEDENLIISKHTFKRILEDVNRESISGIYNNSLLN
jgi:predicted acetyltransferase